MLLSASQYQDFQQTNQSLQGDASLHLSSKIGHDEFHKKLLQNKELHSKFCSSSQKL